MKEAASFAAAAILLLVAAIHFYWAMGGSTGKAAAIPAVGERLLFTPGRGVTAAVGAALFLMAVLVAAAGGLLASPLPVSALRVATALLAFLFAARAIGDFRYVGFFKRVVGSAFARWDSCLYSPLCLLVATLIGVVATP